MPERIIANTGCGFGKAAKRDQLLAAEYGIAEQVDHVVALPIENGSPVDVDNVMVNGRTVAVDNATAILTDSFDRIGNVTKTSNSGVSPFDIVTELRTDYFDKLNSSTKGYYSKPAVKDIVTSHRYHGAHLLADKPHPPGDFKYLPTADFIIDSELTGFTADFDEPIDYDNLKTPLSPVGMATSFPWQRTRKVDVIKKLGYGYSINKFLVGGSTSTSYPIDPDAVTPTEPNLNPDKVKIIVNTVSVVVLPDRTPLLVESLTLTRHLEAFAWDCNLTLLDEASFNLIKPSPTSAKDIEVEINGTKWQFFISRTTKPRSFGDETYTAKGFSLSAQLQHPYASLTNFTNSTSGTASQLANAILTGTGYSVSWQISADWVIPANGFSYQNKSPIDALSMLASSVGGVIKPHHTDKSIEIMPWSVSSPWQWQTLTNLKTLDEVDCYDIVDEYNPQPNANGLYVSGNGSGSLIKAKLPGTPGDILLPTVSDPLITDISAATERGRIELAKSGDKEDVPITRFIDDTLLLPGEMVTVNKQNNTSWNGLVINCQITVANQGAEIYQKVDVLRHHE